MAPQKIIPKKRPLKEADAASFEGRFLLRLILGRAAGCRAGQGAAAPARPRRIVWADCLCFAFCGSREGAGVTRTAGETDDRRNGQRDGLLRPHRSGPSRKRRRRGRCQTAAGACLRRGRTADSAPPIPASTPTGPRSSLLPSPCGGLPRSRGFLQKSITADAKSLRAKPPFPSIRPHRRGPPKGRFLLPPAPAGPSSPRPLRRSAPVPARRRPAPRGPAADAGP